MGSLAAPTLMNMNYVSQSLDTVRLANTPFYGPDLGKERSLRDLGGAQRGTHVADLLLEEADNLPLALHHLDVEVGLLTADVCQGWASQEPRGGRSQGPRHSQQRADTRCRWGRCLHQVAVDPGQPGDAGPASPGGALHTFLPHTWCPGSGKGPEVPQGYPGGRGASTHPPEPGQRTAPSPQFNLGCSFPEPHQAAPPHNAPAPRRPAPPLPDSVAEETAMPGGRGKQSRRCRRCSCNAQGLRGAWAVGHQAGLGTKAALGYHHLPRPPHPPTPRPWWGFL